MQVWPRSQALFHGVMALLVGGMAGAVVWVTRGSLWGVMVGALVGVLAFAFLMRKYFRRRRMAPRPFPEAWRRVLELRVPFYGKLGPEGRRRFENDIRFFLAEQNIYGLRGQPVEEEVKLLVAASAAMLGHGLPDWEWPNLRDIVIYPASFDEEYHLDRPHGGIIGKVHYQGPIIFSEPHLRHGFASPQDGGHVGLHEMAHVMDMMDGAADGVPGGMAWVVAAPWIRVITDRLRLDNRGRCREVLSSYACTNEAEFFAVAVEVFFERPEELRDKDQELYDMLADYFNLDPATGKVLRPVQAD